ncbi:hypothetical protein FLL45_21230 [Aliikangiella marina]|uniref:Uncharacterized protein n=1 Tax=Aliikangiella marina TaxID=1712262 RepID=A0A545T376_9GAMM|nr:hypothetical protein [Aliikangiella marina]TQV71674.1 hypothetical protein FLL45_21230 [Aliikangiella marina]
MSKQFTKAFDLFIEKRSDSFWCRVSTKKSGSMVMPLKDYIELVEWTGQSIIHPDKATIPTHLKPIFQRLNINQDNWLNQVNHYGRNYYRAVGPLHLIQSFADKLKSKWIKGVSSIRSLYLSTT